MNRPIHTLLEAQSYIVLDGGLATELERHGFDLADPLWSARLLLENPAAIGAVHADYLAAGADVIITATYQATLQGLTARGLSHAAATERIRAAVEIAITARNRFWQSAPPNRQRPLVAASIGPYGAYLANGAEYTGDYALGRAGLFAFHHERWQLLANSEADVLACETIPSFAETLALLDLLHTTPQRTAWFSFSCRDRQHISDGTPIAACGRLLDQEPQIAAIGVNCTPPQFIPALITALRQVTSKPIVVYPNSGERWDAVRKCWVCDGQHSAETYAAEVEAWHALGAKLIGGCCRTTPAHIHEIRTCLATDN